MIKQVEVTTAVHSLAIVRAPLAGHGNEIMQEIQENSSSVVRMTFKETKRLHDFTNKMTLEARKLELNGERGG